MRRQLMPARVIAAGVLAALSIHTATSDPAQERQANPATSPDTAIRVLFNPEARVSASRDQSLPLPVMACGQAVSVPVVIINQAFSTALLEARLVDPRPRGVALTFPTQALSGASTEQRILTLTLSGPELTDVTIAFCTKNGISDLGGRDRIHFLVRCGTHRSGI